MSVAEIDADRVLSGQSGIVTGRRARIRGLVADALDEAVFGLRRQAARIDAAAASAGRGGEVLVVGVYAPGHADSMARALTELRRSRRALRVGLAALGEAADALRPDTLLTRRAGTGKFENLNALLERLPPGGAEWVIAVDDDVELPPGFLDRFLFVAERFGFGLAQPALRHTSHAAWPQMRRARGCVARRTAMVEIGPLTAIHRSTAAALLPFPPLAMGWGLDAHWGALAAGRGWRLGVVDATSIRHESRVTASTYDRTAAIEELRGFLKGKPHLERETAARVFECYRAI